MRVSFLACSVLCPDLQLARFVRGPFHRVALAPDSPRRCRLRVRLVPGFLGSTRLRGRCMINKLHDRFIDTRVFYHKTKKNCLEIKNSVSFSWRRSDGRLWICGPAESCAWGKRVDTDRTRQAEWCPFYGALASGARRKKRCHRRDTP